MRNTLRCLIISILLVFLVSPKLAWSATTNQAIMSNPGNTVAVDNTVKTDSITQESVNSAYGKLPLRFEVNAGQTDGQVKFLSHGSGYSMYFTPTETVMVLNKSIKTVEHEPQNIKSKEIVSSESTSSVIRMALINANSDAQISGEEALPGRSNYLTGNDSAKWQTNIINYGKVHYKEVYSGIDLIYYGNQNQLEYDFIVKPGSDPQNIKMTFEGVDNLSIDDYGNLILHTEAGDVVQHKPFVYQTDSANHQAGAIKAQDVLTPAGEYLLLSDKQVAFKIENYDPAKILIIDPLIYSTYIGGSTYDYGLDITVDSSGNAYISGYTGSTNFPTTANAYRTSYISGNDVFIAKLNSTGTALVYSTYIGGNNYEYGNGVTVDSSGNAYIVGETKSSNFPTSAGAYQTTLLGESNAFLVKLNPTGSALVYSTYIGGANIDSGKSIALDTSGNAYITGSTNSYNFPTTAGAFQTTLRGGYDVFVTKLNSTGSELIYSTYLGGLNEFNIGNGIAVDSSGNAYITGRTASSNFPTTAEAYRTFFGGGYDVFVTKLNSTGTALAYSTYLGGSSYDYSGRIAVDISGNAYVTGWTQSNDFPTTESAYQRTKAGNVNVFVTKLNSVGTALVYSTYLGGSGTDYGHCIAVDSFGNTYITGYTASSNFPTTVGTYQSANGGSGDAFLTKLNSLGSALIYSTFIGGSGIEYGYGVALDSSGNGYITGQTLSTDFPTTMGAYQTVYGSNSKSFIAKLSLEVMRTQTNLTLTSLSNPSIYETSATFTATVTGANPSGTVSFMVGSTIMGIGTLSGGIATYKTSSLSVGSHSITAVYSGDSYYANSTSTVLIQTVTQASTINNKAKISSPPDGFTLLSTSQKFVWNQVGANEYHLLIGTSIGTGDIYSQSQGTNNLVTVGNLPSNGITLYVRLWANVYGTWLSDDTTYKAFSDTTTSVSKSEILSPPTGSTLLSTSQRFLWNQAGARGFILQIGTAVGASAPTI